MSIEQYLSAIPSQHYGKPKFTEWLSAALRLGNDIITVLGGFEAAFDLETAQGKQLDVLGEYAGVSRQLDFQPADGSSPILLDDIYRTLIKAKIVNNFWDGTISQVMGLWEALFPFYKIIIKDDQNMSMRLVVVGVATELEKELIGKGYIAPKPEGVRVNYEFPDDMIFAYDLDNDVLSGYDEGMWL